MDQIVLPVTGSDFPSKATFLQQSRRPLSLPQSQSVVTARAGGQQTEQGGGTHRAERTVVLGGPQLVAAGGGLGVEDAVGVEVASLRAVGGLPQVRRLVRVAGLVGLLGLVAGPAQGSGPGCRGLNLSAISVPIVVPPTQYSRRCG
ncbi:hypothetical protein BH18ACI1_BH18ACI1_23980 [soil metagenome]|jgi:hypothetical protein